MSLGKWSENWSGYRRYDDSQVDFWQVISCQVIWREAREQGDKSTCPVNLTSWLVCQVELVTACGTCHLRKKMRIASASEKVFAKFSGHFLSRVLICLNSVFSDVQIVKYDRDMTPHPHHFHCTHSHGTVTILQYRINKTKQHTRTICSQGQQSWLKMEMKRQDHTINSNRHVSPHILSIVCCGESTYAAVTLPSRSLASRCGEHRKIIPRTFFLMFCRHTASAQITSS